MQLLLEKKELLRDYFKQEESEVQQKSRVAWLKSGDRNTKFFHSVVAERRRSNMIRKVKVGEQSLEAPPEIKKAISAHFEHFYNYDHTIKLESLDLNLPGITEEESCSLESHFSLEEIKEAMEQCDGNKAPGLDGFNLNFFKKNWDLLKHDLMKIFDELYETGKFDRKINTSFISLIPKCNSPESIGDYRPISLISSIYKIIAKVLASRMRKVMGKLVGSNQFAFVEGRQIVDSALIANEVVDMMKKRKET